MKSTPLFQDTSPESLVIRARIESFNADYANAIDSDRLEEWPDFFTDKGIYRVATRENRERGLPLALIYATGRGMLQDRITALRTANIYEPHVYCHQISATKLIGRDGDGWRAESNFTIVRTLVSGPMTLFAAGRYYDRFVEISGSLRLAERTCVLDSKQVDTLLVIPI